MLETYEDPSSDEDEDELEDFSRINRLPVLKVYIA